MVEVLIYILVLTIPGACSSVGNTRAPGCLWCTLSCEIALLRRNSPYCPGSGASGAANVVFYRQLWVLRRAGPKTATLSRIPAPTPPDPERPGHLYFGAAPFARGSAMIFFKCRYLRHFSGAIFDVSEHYRRSRASVRTFPVNYRRSWGGACLLYTSDAADE